MPLLFLLLLLFAPPLLAQEPIDCAVATGSSRPLPLACADTSPRLDFATVLPRLERLVLRRTPYTGLAGRLHLGFAVDSTGKALRDSLRVIQASPDDFARQYARHALSELRFAPATRGGRPIPVWYEMEFVYEHAGTDPDLAKPPVALRVERTPLPRGGRIAMRWKAVADAPLPITDERLGREQQVRALGAVISELGSDSPYACVSLLQAGRKSDPTEREIEILRARRLRIAAPAKCPPSYGGMLARFDSAGRRLVAPPGAGPDPQYLTVSKVIPWTADWMVVQVQLRQAGSGANYRCTLHRIAPEEWSAACESNGRWIS